MVGTYATWIAYSQTRMATVLLACKLSNRYKNEWTCSIQFATCRYQHQPFFLPLRLEGSALQ
jgi:hypothetical protein